MKITTVGSLNPKWLLSSFALEDDVRKLWWKVKIGDVVIDVGAGFGPYTITALDQGAYLVVFFEPSKSEFFDICTNLSVNCCMDRVIPLNMLAGNSTGVINDYYPLSHSIRPDGYTEQRIVVKLDEIVEKYELTRVDWLKIDVEGAELAVLQGSLATLQRFQPTLIVENHLGFNPNARKEVQAFLEPLGYKEEEFPGNKADTNENWSKWSI